LQIKARTTEGLATRRENDEDAGIHGEEQAQSRQKEKPQNETAHPDFTRERDPSKGPAYPLKTQGAVHEVPIPIL
jgi:hypothetical protein